MDALAIGGLMFAATFGGALLGLALRSRLPQHHRDAETKDVVRVSIATVATLSALVVGLLIASAKTAFDERDSEVKHAAAQTLVLYRRLVNYGPETQEARAVLRDIVVTNAKLMWNAPAAGAPISVDAQRTSGLDILQRKLLDLVPKDDAQRWLKAQALDTTVDLAQTKWLLLEQTGSSIQWPFLVVLIFWFSIIFVSFGLFAPTNASVIIALFVSALSVGASLFVILEMDDAYGGMIKISDSPVRMAIEAMAN
jgi:hypothetical protein